jgi:hypothetical protein
MDGTGEGLPFLQGEEHRARQGGQGATEHRRVHDPPGDHAEEGQAALQTRGTRELARFNPAATLKDFMPHLHAKAAGVPRHALLGRGGTEDGPGGEQEPFQRRGSSPPLPVTLS